MFTFSTESIPNKYEGSYCKSNAKNFVISANVQEIKYSPWAGYCSPLSSSSFYVTFVTLVPWLWSASECGNLSVAQGFVALSLGSQATLPNVEICTTLLPSLSNYRDLLAPGRRSYLLEYCCTIDATGVIPAIKGIVMQWEGAACLGRCHWRTTEAQIAILAITACYAWGCAVTADSL